MSPVEVKQSQIVLEPALSPLVAAPDLTPWFRM